MNNHVKWNFQNYLKAILLNQVKRGQPRDNIKLIIENEHVLEIPEIRSAINFLVDGEYIEPIQDGAVYRITEGYYQELVNHDKLGI